MEAVGDRSPYPGRKQCFKHLALIVGIGPQQPQEFSLGQHDHLRELFARQVQKLLGAAADSAFAPAFQQTELPILLTEALVGFPEFRGFRVPVDMGVLASTEPVGLPLQGKVKLHQGREVLRSAHAAHPGKTAPAAGSFAV